MIRFLLVCLGGALGAGGRYLSTLALAHGAASTRLPLGTWAVNIIGSFLFALILGRCASGHGPGDDLKLFLTTGVLGGFTTYSTFNADTLGMIANGEVGRGCVNIAVTVVASLLAGGLGMWLGR